MWFLRRPRWDYRTGIAPPLYFRHGSSLEHDTGPHPEGPGRIPAIESELERRGWIGYERREAPEVPIPALTAVHPPAYVDATVEISNRCGLGRGCRNCESRKADSNRDKQCV